MFHVDSSGCLGTPFARLSHVKNLVQILRSILALSCEASVSLVCTLGGHDFWSVSVGGLSQDNASFLRKPGGLCR